jgi:RHS repeat-associated protein
MIRPTCAIDVVLVATMEPENAEEEEAFFDNLPQSRQGAAEHNKTPGGYATAWLNAGRNRILGPSRSQEVQQGDSVALSVYGKYVDPRKRRLHPASFVRTGANTRMIQQLAEYGQNLRAAGPNEVAIANVIALVIGELEIKPAPEAYMGYALYDADSNRYEVGKVVLSKNARNKHEELVENIAITQDGYIETYLVNETEENVWFDQFSILSTGPLIVQETHYDPWGVELSGLGYQYGGVKVNPYLYSGMEANGHLGVNLYDFGARMYDPAIGRWFVVDPMAEQMRRHSPYNYAFNNPMRYIDPDGMAPYDTQGAVVNRLEEEDPTKKSVVDKEEQSLGGENFLWTDGYGWYSASNATLGGDSFNGIYQNAEWTASQYYAALDGLELPNGKTISKNSLYLTFMSFEQLLKINPKTQQGNAHYMGEKDGKYHVNFSVSNFEETKNNIRALGVHEIYGHGIRGFGSIEEHYKAYWVSVDSKYWHGTTDLFKEHAAWGM